MCLWAHPGCPEVTLVLLQPRGVTLDEIQPQPTTLTWCGLGGQQCGWQGFFQSLTRVCQKTDMTPGETPAPT